ncbi:polyamine ABC transporter substrate-binding protein [Pseudomonas jinjuensis]|uniref:Spermidine/putrescine transport system substrate-binding protein n=1 Tax=Pseudomonas jinjuensis TaxID=198616 RepID=A0A1H0KS20_9PSED|nr:spermidine/putrescine ABC transporter substrate-binding protein [Pseudomonas jinjuensis]SDO58581.1 spermidine/putrescine transport system substrate-binding protein [Pseudomonas jinjuensis]
MKNRTDLSRRDFLIGSGILASGAALSSVLPMRSANAAEKELVILAWAGHAEPDIVADFERQHGVKVRAKYYTGGDNMLGLISQSPPGTFDLILSDAEYVQQLKAADYIERLDPSDYPFDDFFPEFQHFPGHWEGNELYSVLIRFGFLGIAYNTQLVPESKVRSYKLFWDDGLKGKVGHFDWHLPNLGQISLYNGNKPPYDIDAAHWKDVQQRLMSLRPQIGGFFDYGGTFSSLKNGQVHAMCGIGDWITGVLERSGAPVRTVVPEEGGLQWTESYCIARKARSPELAKKFIQYITSPEGQVKSARMLAYPALIPSQRGWALLNQVDPTEAKRQGMLLGQRNVMDDIREGRIQYRQLPVQQGLEEWNDFWSEYKGA